MLYNNFFLDEPLFPKFEDFKKAFLTLLTFKNPFPFCSASWYLYTYFFVIFLFPVLNQFIKYLDEDSSRQRNFLIITFIMLVINDFMYNQTFLFSHISINSVFPASIQIIWGYLFYKNHLLFQRKIYSIISITFFIIINFIRSIFLIKFPCRNIVYWYSSFGILNALMIAIFSFCIINNEKCEKSYHYLINYFASNTFGVYLIHIWVRDILLNNNYGKYLASFTYEKYVNNFIFVVYYLILLTLSIFIICSIIVQISSWIINLFFKIVENFVKVFKNNKVD